MIIISAPTLDIDGSVPLRNAQKSDLGGMTRRSSVIATIDGGSVPSYRGFSITDKKIKISAANLTRDERDRLAAMVKTYNDVVLSAREGCFLCAVFDMSESAETVVLNLQVTEELS
jgi:hypothetical protein